MFPPCPREKKVEETILRGIRLLPGDVGAQLKSMLTPQTLAIVVASLVALAVAQAFGIGELIDALVLIAGIAFAAGVLWMEAATCFAPSEPP